MTELRTPRSLVARRVLAAIAGVLAVVLLALIAYLLFCRSQTARSALAGAAGVRPVWVVDGPGEGPHPRFDGPMGVATSDDGRIYVTDAGNSRVCVFDARGRFMFEFGRLGIVKPSRGTPPTYEPGSLNYPVGIAIDDDGNVYVASFYNDTVEVFDAEGHPLRRFPDPYEVTGKGGSGLKGKGIAVTDVAVSGDRVYATDAYQVLVFTREGKLLDQWGKPGMAQGDLDHPNGIAVSHDGDTVYVSDSNHGRVTAFTSHGVVRWQVGPSELTTEAVQAAPDPELRLPRGLAVDRDESVLVSDTFGFEIVRISPDGEVLARYGRRGVRAGEWNFPNDVCVYEGFAVVADKGNNRVQMVRLID